MPSKRPPPPPPPVFFPSPQTDLERDGQQKLHKRDDQKHRDRHQAKHVRHRPRQLAPLPPGQGPPGRGGPDQAAGNADVRAQELEAGPVMAGLGLCGRPPPPVRRPPLRLGGLGEEAVHRARGGDREGGRGSQARPRRLDSARRAGGERGRRIHDPGGDRVRVCGRLGFRRLHPGLGVVQFGDGEVAQVRGGARHVRRGRWWGRGWRGSVRGGRGGRRRRRRGHQRARRQTPVVRQQGRRRRRSPAQPHHPKQRWQQRGRQAQGWRRAGGQHRARRRAAHPHHAHDRPRRVLVRVRYQPPKARARQGHRRRRHGRAGQEGPPAQGRPGAGRPTPGAGEWVGGRAGREVREEEGGSSAGRRPTTEKAGGG